MYEYDFSRLKNSVNRCSKLDSQVLVFQVFAQAQNYAYLYRTNYPFYKSLFFCKMVITFSVLISNIFAIIDVFIPSLKIINPIASMFTAGQN